MQPDYMKMAQGQEKPKEKTMQISPEEAKNLTYDAEAFEVMGAPTGSSKEDVKQRLMMLVEQLDLMELFKTPEAQQRLAQSIDALAEAAMNGNTEEMEANPIYKLIEKTAEQSGVLNTEQPQEEGPTNFAGMVKPPTGGGMSGR